MKAYMKFGLLAGIVFVITNFIIIRAGLGETVTGSLLSFLTYIALGYGIVQSIRERRADQHGYLTYSQGLGAGLQPTLIAAAIAGTWQYVNAKIISPEITAKLHEKMEDNLAEKELSGDELEMAENMTRVMLSPGGQAISVFLGLLLIGFVMSLIIAAIMRRENNNPFHDRHSNNGMPAPNDNDAPNQ